MSASVCRRNSMTILSLYDLESASIHTDSIQTKQQAILTNDKVETSPQKCRLEKLPNEILIYVFEFLSAYDLHRSFYNLNSRLNTLLYDQKLYLDFNSTKRAFDYYCLNRQSLVSHVYRVTLSDQYDRLTAFNQSIDIDCFTNLRVLSIKYASPENVDRILSKLHALPCLSCLDIYSVKIQSPHQVQAIFRIKSLQRLLLYSVDPILLRFDTNVMNPLSQLEYFSLDGCYLSDFLELLKYMNPSLSKMHITLNYRHQEHTEAIDSSVISQLLSNGSMPKFLRHLHMRFYYLSLDNFQSILLLFPNLTHLTFSTSTHDPDYISASVWHSFISANFLALKRLQFHVRLSGLLGNHVQRPSNELMDSFFEMHKNWLIGPVMMDYYHASSPPSLEVYTYPQPVRGGKSSSELYGRERYVTSDGVGTEVHTNKGITQLKITLTDEQLMIRENDVYPDVKSITIHSQMTTAPVENDIKCSSIRSDVIKSIPDLSQIKSLYFTHDLSIHAAQPSATLARHFLYKMPKMTTMQISYDYLIRLINSPLIVLKLRRQISSISIDFYQPLPVPEDLTATMNILSENVHFLYFDVRCDFSSYEVHRILPLIFSEKWKKLHTLRWRLLKQQGQQCEKFSESSKQRLRNDLSIETEKRRTCSTTMEYRITDSDFSISF